MINLDNYGLIIFGDFGVLTNTPFKDHQPLHIEPGRAEYLAWVQEDRIQRVGAPLHYAVTGNKGGVAWASQTEAEAEEEVRWTAEQIGSTHYRVCFACSTTRKGFEYYATPELLKRRKPRTPMFEELIEQLGVPAERVLIIDHYADSYSAAKRLGCAWQAPGTFFAHAESYLSTATAEQEQPPDDLDLFDIDTVLLAMEEE